ncbi:DUF6493 family protein [Streptosporangium amethystogenes]|uniref:DUF6493 family protein n=1 Tax=Streptosporangium amethystogenes TaxID=2002 RepID=UPI0004C6DC1B|nr:DUF6493 family protein [Streptosporangium amethystogenes]
MTVWEEVRDLIGTGDAFKVATRVAALDDAGRRKVARELPGHIQGARREVERRLREYGEEYNRFRLARGEAYKRFARERGVPEHEIHHRWAETLGWGGDMEGTWEGPKNNREYHRAFPPPFDGDAWIDPMLVAGAGTLPGAAAVVAWLNRRDFECRGRSDDLVEPVLQAVAARPAGWQADLAVRLALRVRVRRERWEGDPRDRNLPLTLALLGRTGVTPPEHDPLVVAWAGTPPTTERLREDPLLDVLLPRLFQAQGVGRELREERADPLAAKSWLGALRTLAAEGRVSREALLEGCVGRFLRGGGATDLRFFARLHELLEPSPAEVASRAGDYLRLLPVAPGPVAELSLRHLRHLDSLPRDNANDLDPDDVSEALSGLLFRAESGLVRSGLAWLDRFLRREPERADELSPALALALGHEAPAVQERVVRLLVGHAAAFGPLGAETVRDAAGRLPADLSNRLVGAFGGDLQEEPEPEPEPEEPFVPDTLPAPPPATAFPVPRTPQQVAALFGKKDWAEAEGFLGGFVRLAAGDPDGLRDALAAHSERPPAHGSWTSPECWGAAIVAEFVDPGAEHLETGFGLPADVRPESPWTRLPGRDEVCAPEWLVLRRHAEILVALKEGVLPPLLLATPTLSTGHLDPVELVARIEELERAGVEPLPADLAQALLRLPRTTDSGTVTRAAVLTSAAGRETARRLAGSGLPDPVVTVRRFCSPGAEPGWMLAEDPAGHWLDEREPKEALQAWQTLAVASIMPSDITPGDITPGDRADEEAGTSAGERTVRAATSLIAELLVSPPRFLEKGRGHHGKLIGWWPGVMPSHREVIAAHMVPLRFRSDWTGGLVDGPRLTDLACAQGPVGQATALLLVERLALSMSVYRRRAVRYLLATGDLPAAQMGTEFGERVRRSWLSISTFRTIMEDAVCVGTHREAWAMIAAALPGLLAVSGGRPPRELVDFLAFARQVARRVKATGEIPEVTAVAGRKGSTQVIRECRGLRDLLSAP